MEDGLITGIADASMLEFNNEEFTQMRSRIISVVEWVSESMKDIVIDDTLNCIDNITNFQMYDVGTDDIVCNLNNGNAENISLSNRRVEGSMVLTDYFLSSTY